MEMVSTMEEEKDSCGHLMEPIQQLSMATCAGVGGWGGGAAAKQRKHWEGKGEKEQFSFRIETGGAPSSA